MPGPVWRSSDGTNFGTFSDPDTDALASDTDLDAYVAKSLFDANTVLAANTDNTPAALTVGASTFVGRKASGNIAAMSTTEALALLGHDINSGTHSNALRPTGALTETVPRSVSRLENIAFLASARLNLVAVYLTAGQTVTTITFVSSTTALSTATNQWFALYDSARAKLAVTTDDTSTAWASNATKSLNLASPYSVVTSGLYYLGICVVATTVPTLAGLSSPAGVVGLAPILGGISTTGLTDPASAPTTAAAITAQGGIPYAYVT